MTASDHATKPFKNTLRERGHPYMGFLGPSRLAAIIPVYTYWISLDSSSESRLINGLREIFREDYFPRPSPLRETGQNGSLRSRPSGSAGLSCGKLTFLSDFLQ